MQRKGIGTGRRERAERREMVVWNRGERRSDKGRKEKKCRQEKNDTPQTIIYNQIREE